MTLLSTARGRELARELRDLAGERLNEALAALARCSPRAPASPTALEELLTARLADVDPRLSRDAHVHIGGPNPVPRPIRLLLVARLGELRRFLLSRALPELDFDRQDRLVNLICFSAGAMIPLLALAGEYRRAVSLAGVVQRAVISRDHRRVVGAGGTGGDPRLRFLLMAPVLWSLAAHFPSPDTGEIHNEFDV